MSDENITIKLKTNPGMPQDQNAENLSVNNGAATAKTKNCAPPPPPPSSIQSQFVQPKTNKKRHKLTKAELHYRLRVVFSIIFLVLFLAFLAVVALGAGSMYVVYEISKEPRKAYIVYDTAKLFKRTSDIKGKFNVINDGVKKFVGKAAATPVEAAEEKSYGGTLRKIQERSKAGENAANSGTLVLK